MFQGCLGVFWDGAASIVPYGGIFETCQINNPPRFITDCDCNSSAWQTQTGSRAKFTPSAQGCLYNMKADGTGLERATFRNCCSNDPSVPLTTADPFNGLYIGMFQTGTIRGILVSDGRPLFVAERCVPAAALSDTVWVWPVV